MRWILILCLTLLLARPAAAAEPPPEKLELTHLVNRADRLPPSVTVGRDIVVDEKVKIRKGDSVRVVAFDGKHATIEPQPGERVNIALADCDLLEAANAAWAALTPAQRAVDPDTLAADRSLWPLTVTLPSEVTLRDGARLPAGVEFDLARVTTEHADILDRKSRTLYRVWLRETDTVARARERALLEPDERPSRIAAALAPRLVDANGRPVKRDLDQTNVFVLYTTASWCVPCRSFTPQLMQYMKKVERANPRLAVIVISADQDEKDRQQYMTATRMPWPSITYTARREIALLRDYWGKSIPNLVVIDRHGTVLADSYTPDTYTDPEEVLARLTPLLESGIARARPARLKGDNRSKKR